MPLTRVCQTGGASTQKAGTLHIIHHPLLKMLHSFTNLLPQLSIHMYMLWTWFLWPKDSLIFRNSKPNPHNDSPPSPLRRHLLWPLARQPSPHWGALKDVVFWCVLKQLNFSLFFWGNATQDTMHLNGQIIPNICVKQRCASACYSRLSFHKVLLEIPLQPGTPSKPGF